MAYGALLVAYWLIFGYVGIYIGKRMVNPHEDAGKPNMPITPGGSPACQTSILGLLFALFTMMYNTFFDRKGTKMAKRGRVLACMPITWGRVISEVLFGCGPMERGKFGDYFYVFFVQLIAQFCAQFSAA